MNTLPNSQLRWGICSAGKISNDFVAAVKLLPSSEHQIAAVAARKAEDATKFASIFGIPRVHTSYEDLANDKELDIIYIGSIHPQHFPLCKLFLEAGHNVLCEKPLTLNRKQIPELLEIAKRKNVFLMEGFWSRCFPVYEHLKQAITDNTIGDIKMVHANFGDGVYSSGDVNPRLYDKALGGGVLMDMGCYPVMFANFVFRDKPEKIVAHANLRSTGVDGTTVITLFYSNGRIARLSCSHECDLDNAALVSGTKGKIVIPNFWCPQQMDLNGKNIDETIPVKSAYPMFFRGCEGFMYEAKCVRECLLKGLKECPQMPHQDTLDIMEILDEVRRQIGVTYDVDKA